MTVCIAAICDNGTCIVGATDRKVTARDIQFEPPIPKSWMLGHKIVALVAGDSSAQADICTRVWRRTPASVADALEMYCWELGDYNRRQAERKILWPLGLTMQGFLADRQMPLATMQLLRQEIGEERAEIQTIICGIDATGAHIYTVYSDGSSQLNIGFSAVGDGLRHASSQFMFAGYTLNWQLPRALMLAYTAKKHAEVAPGVGRATDVFFMTRDIGFQYLLSPICDVLESAFNDSKAAQESTLEGAYGSIEKYLDKSAESPPPQNPTAIVQDTATSEQNQ